MIATNIAVTFKFDKNSQKSYGFQVPKPPPYKKMEIKNDNNKTIQFPNSSTKVKMLPNAIIIGVRKGGTRALLRGLALHPNIHTATKEIHFFDRDQNYAKGIEWYRSMMPQVSSAPGQIVMEKSPSYFVTPGVPERIYKMSRTVKLLVIVRNPTKRAISDYTQLKVKNSKLPSFEKYITSDENESVLDSDNRIVQCGLYGNHLKRWLLYFPISQIHFVSGEALINHPAQELKKVEKFLKLKPGIHEKDFVYNKTKGFPCFRRTSSNAHLIFSCLGATKGRVHPKVRQDIIDALNEFYEPHNKLLYRMVTRDFHWNN
ncbi:Heparan sulfate glucosamine 3-O-sulfotransferase 4 [Exaiptasia diaphana]|nr:Heparan sulfate glucosamine 3-O-sulfotransferase 4 [Exaiptasia diaphana]